MSADAKLTHGDRVADLQRTQMPTLVVGARHDTMDPAHTEMMAGLLPRGRSLYCPNGSHLSLDDDQQTYFAGLDFRRHMPTRT